MLVLSAVRKVIPALIGSLKRKKNQEGVPVAARTSRCDEEEVREITKTCEFPRNKWQTCSGSPFLDK